MRSLRRLPVLLASLLTVAAAAAPVQAALAGPARASEPGHWTQVTAKLTDNDDVGLARGKDGVLHVLWTSGGTGPFRVFDTPIKASGVGRPGGHHSGAHLRGQRPGQTLSGSTLAADPFGRLWVAWFRGQNNSFALWVRRAKTGASQFGQVKRVSLPKGTSEVWKIYINAQAKKLDVVALLTVKGKIAYWTTQVLPPKQ